MFIKKLKKLNKKLNYDSNIDNLCYFIVLSNVKEAKKQKKAKKMKRFSNMTEFAAHLGLARCTVSFILNNKWRDHNISPKTAKRVLELAAASHFVPNYLGRAINGKVKINVAFLLPQDVYDHHREAFFSFIKMINDDKLKYLVMQLGDDENNQNLIERMHNFRIDKAVVIAAPLLSEKERFNWWIQTVQHNPEINFLFYDYRFDREPAGLKWPENVYIAGFDAVLANWAVVDYIAAAGYKSFHLFNADRSHCTVKRGQELGMEVQVHERINQVSPFELGEIIGAHLAGLSRQGPVAVFIGDDIITISVVKYLLERGFRVPEDFAFISWDGLRISNYFLRVVTTLEIPHTEMLSYTKRFVTSDDCERRLIVTPRIRVGETMPVRKPIASDAPKKLASG